MKRRALIKQITSEATRQNMAFEIDREGKHTVYSLDGLMIPIPRHSEINERTARDTLKECEQS